MIICHGIEPCTGLLWYQCTWCGWLYLSGCMDVTGKTSAVWCPICVRRPPDEVG